VGGILVEREMSARLVVVREVASEGPAQVPFAKDKYVHAPWQNPFAERVIGSIRRE